MKLHLITRQNGTPKSRETTGLLARFRRRTEAGEHSCRREEAGSSVQGGCPPRSLFGSSRCLARLRVGRDGPARRACDWPGRPGGPSLPVGPFCFLEFQTVPRQRCRCRDSAATVHWYTCD